MKSITFGIGYLLAVMVVDVSSADNIFLFNEHTTPVSTIPYNFGYYKASNSLLTMVITLKNIPPSVTAVTAIGFIYYNSVPQRDTTKVNVDKNTREGKFIIVKHLKEHQIWFVVQLYIGEELCNETKITDGRDIPNSYSGAYYWESTQNKVVYYKYEDYWEHYGSVDCLAPKVCEIILDLEDTCKEQPNYGDNVECHIKESQYICTFVRAATNFQDLKLYQSYEDNSVIGPIWEIKQKTAKLSIMLELELFDNNTSVKLVSTRLRTNKTICSDTLSITAQDISKTSNVTLLKYTETTDVQFSCQQYKHRSTQIHIGFINTTDNKITTLNTTILRRNKFKMADNGTILCCLFYESTWQKKTRFVENKILLIYQPQESTPTNLTEGNEQKKECSSGQDKWWLYVLPTLLVTAVLLLAFCIVKKQRWCSNSQPAEETVELDNNATTNQVLYANLDFVHNESRAENHTEESPYANIIGVLHPL